MDLHPRPLHDDTDLDATTPTGVPGFGRRHALKLMAAGAGLLTLAACGQSSSDDPAASGSTATSTTTAGSTTSTASSTASSGASSSSASSGGSAEETIPEETGGPYPGDGTQRPQRPHRGRRGPPGHHHQRRLRVGHRRRRAADHHPDRARRRRRRAAAPAGPCTSGTATREGGYSMYSDGITDENYLRGVQEIDANGKVTFTSIFPAAYSGRWPHIHFKVYSSVDDATGGGKAIATSQLALPEDVCDVGLRHRGLQRQHAATWPPPRSTATMSSATATTCSWPRSRGAWGRGTPPPSPWPCDAWRGWPIPGDAGRLTGPKGSSPMTAVRHAGDIPARTVGPTGWARPSTAGQHTLAGVEVALRSLLRSARSQEP